MAQYTVRRREDGVDCIYLTDYAVAVAEFAENTRAAAKEVGLLLDAAPRLLAALEAIVREYDAATATQDWPTAALFAEWVAEQARTALAAVRGEE